MVLLYGHCGAKGEAPENTEVACTYAGALYLDGVQLDVRLSSDGELVVIHDETVDRTTTSRGRVSQMTAARLARLDARADFPEWPEPAGVPTLDAAIAASRGLQRIVISIQPDEPRRLHRLCERLVELFERRSVGDRFVVLATDETVVQQLRRAAPALTVGLAGWFDGVEQLQRAERLGCGQIAVPVATCARWLVEGAHVLGIEVIGWLGNTPEEINAFADWGVDAIVSDFPAVAKHTLAAR